MTKTSNIYTSTKPIFNLIYHDKSLSHSLIQFTGPKMKSKRNSFFMTIKNKKIKDSCDNSPRKPQNQLDCKESEQKKKQQTSVAKAGFV